MPRFLNPRPITVSSELTGRRPRAGDYELVDGPSVAVVFPGAWFELKSGDFGYHFLEDDICTLSSTYAWPWPLWAALRLCVELRNLTYACLRRLHRWHLIRLARPEHYPFRWRDLRLTLPWR
jgi:hypothetical protein